MAEIKLRKIMRCPVCFARENDVTLMQDGDEYYCVHCSYHGTAEHIAGIYMYLRDYDSFCDHLLARLNRASPEI